MLWWFGEETESIYEFEYLGARTEANENIYPEKN